MFKSACKNGVIDQTMFKTKDKYGFDSLIFSEPVLLLVNDYINIIRGRLNPVCEYVLVNRNGKQLTKLGELFGRLVYQAIEKYVHPTRYNHRD